MRKRTKQLLSVLVIVAVCGVSAFVANQILNPPLTLEEKEAITIAEKYSRDGHPQIKPIVSETARLLDGKIDTSDEAMKVTFGKTVVCELDGKQGGAWHITSWLDSTVKPSVDLFDEIGSSTREAHPDFTKFWSKPNELMLEGIDNVSMRLTFLKDDTYEIELQSSCLTE